MAIAFLSMCIWVYLVLAHAGFWRSSIELTPAIPAEHPNVDIIVPARDEAATIGVVIASLLAQDYRGNFSVTLVDDNSSDATARLAGADARLRILRLNSKPARWSGKLWALNQGALATAAPLLLFTDADIVHDPRHLSTLVAEIQSARLGMARLGMVSEMVRLNCASVAERALVPAFVYFFQMLYPFARVNDPKSRLAAAAGGTVLVRREVLAALGGLETIRDTLIDDVALARAAKRVQGIFLGHSGLASSIRRYPHFADVWQMIARTAYTQLRHSPALLGLTMIGLTVVWWVPVWALTFGSGLSRIVGAAGCVLAALSYQPTLRRYRRNPLWALALPLIAGFYMAATLSSALNYWRGSGARWKNRSYDREAD